MSVAIMAHKEANGTNAGVFATTTADTFSARKLNTLLVNQDSTILSFDPAAYTFTLGPGVYRFVATVIYNPKGATGDTGYTIGLFNVTTGLFEVNSNSGVTNAILGTTGFGADSTPIFLESNRTVRIEGHFTVTSTNKTYQLRQKTDDSVWASLTTSNGIADQMSGANVNSSAASQFYAVVRVGREH